MALGQRLFGKLGGFRGLRSTTVGGDLGPRSQFGTAEEQSERFQQFLGAAGSTGSAIAKIGAGISASKELKLAAFDEKTNAIRALTAGHFKLAEGVAQFTEVSEAILGSSGVRGITSSGSIATALDETATTQSVFENAVVSEARINHLARLQRAAKLKRLEKNVKFNAIFGGLASIATSLAGARGGGGA